MVNKGAWKYLQSGLAATPIVLDRLCASLTDAEADLRPDPDRFTIREALAHLADWEGVWAERITRIRDEDDPFLPGYDEGQWAIDNHYESADPSQQLARFRAGRAALCAILKDLAFDDWSRTGRHEELGEMTIGDFAALILGHDGYHLRQAAEYRQQV